jgi:hypothetical protein
MTLPSKHLSLSNKATHNAGTEWVTVGCVSSAEAASDKEILFRGPWLGIFFGCRSVIKEDMMSLGGFAHLMITL